MKFVRFSVVHCPERSDGATPPRFELGWSIALSGRKEQPPVRRASERETRSGVTKKQARRPAFLVTHTPICILANSRPLYLRMRIEWHVTRFLRTSTIICCHFAPQASANGRTQRRGQKQGFLSVKSSYARLGFILFISDVKRHTEIV